MRLEPRGKKHRFDPHTTKELTRRLQRAFRDADFDARAYQSDIRGATYEFQLQDRQSMRQARVDCRVRDGEIAHIVIDAHPRIRETVARIVSEKTGYHPERYNAGRTHRRYLRPF